jgi:ribosomal protein S27E
MLSGYQVATVAYTTEYGELICESCAERIVESCGASAESVGGILDALRLGILDAGKVPISAPISRYELDEHRAALIEDEIYCGDRDEDDESDYSIECEDCGSELV